MAKRPASRATPARGARRPASRGKPAGSARRKDRAAAGGRALRIRMYRQGLGDCFLVTLPKSDGSPFFLMIDCGVILGTEKPEPKMQRMVADIIATTKGFIDLLVVTHEHWDHVSGFVQAQDLFRNKLSVGEVWFAWTEDPNDKLAQRLRKERAERVAKLSAFAAGARARGFGELDQDAVGMVDGIEEILSFFGVKPGKAPGGTGAAMEFARTLSPKVRYCRPSDKVRQLAEVPDVRVYVLGPPADEVLLRKTDSRVETYRELMGLGAAASFFSAAALATPEAAADGGTEELQYEFNRHQPFDQTYCRRLDPLRPQAQPVRSELAAFLDRHYFGLSSDPLAPDQAWRRIDHVWLGAAADFALQLDSATNNTSLVLAIELTDSDKVLLFAADAQVGNWLSWRDLAWQRSGDSPVTGTDLLNRTVFYKVGHHGSHNATLKAKGLELMRSDEFVAFVPVNQAMAGKKGWHRMPLPGLIEELGRKSKGRVVRSDEEYKVPTGDDGTAAKFARELKAHPQGLYYEWTLPLGD